MRISRSTCTPSGPANSDDPAAAGAAVELELPEAVLALHETLREAEVGVGARLDARDAAGVAGDLDRSIRALLPAQSRVFAAAGGGTAGTRARSIRRSRRRALPATADCGRRATGRPILPVPSYPRPNVSKSPCNRSCSSLGLALGGAVAWLFMRAHARSLQSSFEALSARALRDQQVEGRQEFEMRQRAIEQLVKPMAEGLDKVRGELEQLERARRESHGSLTTHLRSVAETQERLRSETVEPGHRAAGAGHARALGRDPAAPRLRDGRHDRPLRLRGAVDSRLRTRAGCART